MTSGVSLDSLDGDALMNLLALSSVELARAEARRLAVLAEIGQRSPAECGARIPRMVGPHDYSWDEVAAELRWSEGQAALEVQFAHAVSIAHPGIGAALAAGVIDRGKAWTLTSVLKTVHRDMPRPCWMTCFRWLGS